MSLLGSIVGGVLGLFGGKKKEETVTKNTVDYVQMQYQAKQAGFNPLTALRNGGSAGFTTSTTTSPTTSQLPGALQSIGGALGDALSEKFDPVEQKKRQLDTALVDYQLRQLNEGPKATTGRLYPGGTFQGTKVSRSTPSMSVSRKLAPYVEEGKLTNTNPWAWTNGIIESSPDRVDGAAYEDAYGDFLGGAAAAVVPTLHDIWHNAKRAYSWARPFMPSSDHGAVGRFKQKRDRKLIYSDKGPAGR